MIDYLYDPKLVETTRAVKPPQCAHYRMERCKASGRYGTPPMCETHDRERMRLARRLSPNMLELLHTIDADPYYSRGHSATISALRLRGLLLFPSETGGKWLLTAAGREAMVPRALSSEGGV